MVALMSCFFMDSFFILNIWSLLCFSSISSSCCASFYWCLEEVFVCRIVRGCWPKYWFSDGDALLRLSWLMKILFTSRGSLISGSKGVEGFEPRLCCMRLIAFRFETCYLFPMRCYSAFENVFNLNPPPTPSPSWCSSLWFSFSPESPRFKQIFACIPKFTFLFCIGPKSYPPTTMLSRVAAWKALDFSACWALLGSLPDLASLGIAWSL